MAVDEGERVSSRLTAGRGRSRFHVGSRAYELDPATVATIDAVLPAPREAVVRIVGGDGATGTWAGLLPSPPANPAVASAPDVLVVSPADDGAEHLGPDLSMLERACTTAVDLAVPGQTIILTAASYVGCARDLLVVPLAARGLRVGEDIHVAASPDPLHGSPSSSQPRVVGGATQACAALALEVLRSVGPVTVVGSLEQAEAASLTSDKRFGPGFAAKRLLDVAGALLGLALGWPLMLVIALAIALDSGRPIFFTQERVGLNGHRFKFRKFRTMVPDAEGRLVEVIHLNRIKGPGFQLERDPRVTRIGHILRVSSLDELPQLWNVLRGDMSLVGPRPAPVVEVARYRPWHRRRLAVKPGITGLAQVRARRYHEFDTKAGIDLQYIDHWSIWLDLEILLRTVPAVLRLSGR